MTVRRNLDIEFSNDYLSPRAPYGGEVKTVQKEKVRVCLFISKGVRKTNLRGKKKVAVEKRRKNLGRLALPRSTGDPKKNIFFSLSEKGHFLERLPSPITQSYFL